MIEQPQSNWWLYWAFVASAGFILFRFTQTDSTKSRADRVRSLLRGNRYSDPKSPAYDPGFFGRQMRLLLIGLPLIGAVMLFIWLQGK